MGLFYSIAIGFPVGLTWGMISGFVFGLIMAIYVLVQYDKARSNPPVLIDEVLGREAAAQLLTDEKKILGGLYLTDKRLIFEAYPGNFKTEAFSIPIHEISEVEDSRSFGIFSGSLRIVRSDGRTETFALNDGSAWAEDLDERRQSYLSEARSDNARLFR